eukprot:TRINITY_DN23281_c0_g2_i3.p1 TRINITY_DN23281_c0_g2~~TRINITY_DN23281_c0_g2_i3.p1  ORF type:complete len:788 (+),score=312.07 TRINITY_DN23281_c0_g2_i3:49-2364(+)
MAPAATADAAAVAAAAAATKAISEAAEVVSRLLEQPETLLDPSEADAKKVAEGARSLAKAFFDAAWVQSPQDLKLASGVPALVVDGFDRDQIWEELEIQNVPLRRHLRRRVAKLAEAPKGAVDLQPDPNAAASDARAEASASAAAKETSARRRSAKVAASDEDDEGSDDAEKLGAGARRAKRTKKAKAAKRAADASGDEEQDAEDADEAGPSRDADGPLEDGFLNLDEMQKFADMADTGKMRLDDDAEDDSDFGLLEADEDGEDDDDEGKNAKFADFFAAPEEGRRGKAGSKAASKATAKRRKQDDEESDDDEGEGMEFDEEGESEEGGLADGGDDADELSDEEKELEEQIRQMQAGIEGGEESEEEDDKDAGESEENDEDVAMGAKAGADSDDDATGEAEVGAKQRKKRGDDNSASLYEMDKRLRQMEEEVERLEDEQLEDKHWSMRGEVKGKERPMNSLLEMHLEQPMTHFAGRRAEAAAGTGPADAAGGEGGEDDDLVGAAAPPSAGFDIEAIIRQRVWDETFDDVVRRSMLPPSQRPQGDDEELAETLNFQKSRVGLGDIYAKQYEEQFMGHESQEKVKEDKEKTEAKALFAKVMFKLDQLTNAHFTPKAPTLGASGAQLAKVPAVKMEETIPLMMSEEGLKAPEEQRAPMRHAKGRDELDREERSAARRLKKTGRRKALTDKVESGEMSLAGMRERSKKLQQKNREAKEAEVAKGKIKEAKKRIRSTELLSQAASSASNTLSRKESIRQERQQRAEGAPTSKKLKL